MNAPRPIRLAVVAGEESGDLLGADVVDALRRAGHEVTLAGVGGRHLEARGLAPLFDADEIALMGLTQVALGLPRLIRRIGQTARAVVEARPDCLLTIDTPDFSLRVARKVRVSAPAIPTVHYVSPSVWAWRPGRAAAMRAYVDRLLCVLPFEPAMLEKLGGPPSTYVGHRLTAEPGLMAAAATQSAKGALNGKAERTLLVLPGSRRSEVSALLGPFGETVRILAERGFRPDILLPTLPRLAGPVRTAVAGWAIQPRVTTGAEEKWQAFARADAALIASGTVSLELALAGVPMLSCYRLDPLMRMAQGLVTVWSALLPNLIADRPVAPEYYNQFVRPDMLARALEALLADTPMRDWQKQGLAEVARRMRTERPPGETAADILLDLLDKGRAR
ncbi:MAG: lipid-A-disaccharide synthase [Rhizobiaceae bacterium]